MFEIKGIEANAAVSLLPYFDAVSRAVTGISSWWTSWCGPELSIVRVNCAKAVQEVHCYLGKSQTRSKTLDAQLRSGSQYAQRVQAKLILLVRCENETSEPVALCCVQHRVGLIWDY